MAPPEALRAALSGCSLADLVFVAQQQLVLGAWDHALALCEAWPELGDPSLALCHAVARFVGGDGAGALEEVEQVLSAHPRHLSALAVKAQLLARSGQAQPAVPPLLELLTRYPDYPGGHGLLATLLMPGPHYREVLKRVHQRSRPRSYLEIGIESGATLALAEHSQIVIGIDPAEPEIKHALPPGTRLYREESDAFFAARSRDSVLGARRLDLSFIDGMHRVENALSDFANAESWSHAGGTIVLHDCVPLLARTAARERETKFWVGDTWKTVLALKAYRPDLRVRTLLCPPSGLVFVRHLNPGSEVLRDQFGEIVERMSEFRWEHLPGEYPPEFSVQSNDERGLLEALG